MSFSGKTSNRLETASTVQQTCSTIYFNITGPLTTSEEGPCDYTTIKQSV